MSVAVRARAVLVTVVAALALALVPGCMPKTPEPPQDPGAILAGGALATPLLLAGSERTVYARIRIETQALPERPRGPVNVALAIDTSGSMMGAPIEESRRAALAMIAALADGDRLAVVAFHTETVVVLPSTELDREVRAEVNRKVAALEAIGTTDLGGGLAAAVREVRGHFDPHGVNRVVLLGDGIPNDPRSIEPTARDAGEAGIAITSLGLGLDYDEILMGKIAELSGGRYRYVESADKVASFYQEELLRMHTVYARGASLVLTAGPGVRLEAVAGAPNPPSGGKAYVPIGDIARGDSRDVVVRMKVTPRKADVPIELLDAVLSFQDGVGTGARLERRVFFGAMTSSDAAKVAAARNAEVELAAALAEAGTTTLTALGLAKQGKYVRARALLKEGAEAALSQAKQTPSPALEKHAADMERVAADMPETDPAPVPSSVNGYDFADDELVSPMPAAEMQLSVPSARMRKEVHQKAYEMSH
ncbi:MAG: VWA domain-containing protein [Polyangiaceae bacterium]|nr:VWA domain-containing protein [Polyangiaceae bacterium]